MTLLLLSAVIVLGVVRSALPKWRPLLVGGVHRNLALVALAFAAAHVVSAVLDPYAHLKIVDALVPFVSAYRPIWLGLGVVSAFLISFVMATSWPVRRFSNLTWQWLHRMVYIAWVAAVLHAIGTGSDTRNPAYLVLDVTAVISVAVTFVGLRAVEGWRGRPLASAAAAAVTVVTVVLISVWLFTGPLQPGWARQAGPPDLLAHPPSSPGPTIQP